MSQATTGEIPKSQTEIPLGDHSLLDNFDSYAQMCIAAAVLAVPIVFSVRSSDTFGITKLTVLWVASITALALYLAWPGRRLEPMPAFTLGWAVMGFLGALLLATLLAGSPALSALGLPSRMGGLVSYCVYALFAALIVALYWRQPTDLSLLVQSTIAGATGVTIYILIQVSGNDWINWVNNHGRPFKYPHGSLGNSNFAGGFLGIVMPLFAYMFLEIKRRGWKLTFGALSVVNIAALWLTQSRGGFIAAFAGVGIMGISMRDALPKVIRRLMPVAVVVGTIIAILVLFHPGTDRPIGPLAKIDVFRTETFENRTAWWKAAIEVFKEDPLTGSGLDHFHLTYPLHKSVANFEVEKVDKPHNVYLEHLAGAGVLGLGSYILLIGLGLRMGYRESRKPQNPYRMLTATFLGMLAGYLGQAIFSIDVPPIAVMGWFALGAIAALADPKVSARRRALASAPELSGLPG